MGWALIRPLRARRRGDAVVEFALLAPTLLLLLFGILEIGRVLDAWLIVENAAREGARVGVSTPASDPTATAQAAASAYLNSALAGRIGTAGDIAAIPQPLVQYDANTVQVSIEVDVQLYTPIFQSMLHSPVPVRATVSMRR